MNNDIYDMVLHGTMREDTEEGHLIIRRVPGGWLYTFMDLGHSVMTTTFVRYHNEFQLTTTQEKGEK